MDTGNTLFCLISHLKSKGACSISVCTFLDKPARRRVHFELVGEGRFYRGFEVRIFCYLSNLKSCVIPRNLTSIDKFSTIFPVAYWGLWSNLAY